MKLVNTHAGMMFVSLIQIGLVFLCKLQCAASHECTGFQCGTSGATPNEAMGSVLLQRSLDATQVSTEALAVLEAGAPYHLIKNDVECNSDDKKIFGKKKNASVAECAQAVKALGGQFFIYGKGRKATRCYKENTDSADCPEGFDDDKYDFYEVEGFPTQAPHRLVKSDHECDSNDINMGKKASLEKCALAVKAAGGRFFIYGKGKKANKCYMENTESADCPEGWDDDHYDFYELEAETPTEPSK